MAFNEQKGDVGQKGINYFNSFFILLCFSVLVVVFLVLFKGQAQLILNGSRQIPFYSWLLTYLFLASPSYFIEYIYLKEDKSSAIIIYGVISYGLQFLLLAVPPIVGLPIEYSVKGLVMVSGLRFVYLLYILHRYAKFSISMSFIGEHLKLAYPLIVGSLLSGSGQYIDGAIITYFFGEEMFAVFRYGAREFPLVIIMANALSHAMIPEFSRLSLEDALVALKSNSIRLMHFLFPVTAIVLLASNILFPFLFTSGFAFSAKIFNIYLLLITLRLIFPETILIGMQTTRVFLFVSFFEMLINVSLSVIFVRWIGIVGVAYATLLANLFERIILVGIVKRKFNVSLGNYVPLRLYSIYCAVFLVIYFVVDFLVFPFQI
ncbi:polysaccharide biosynthesis C-terminal domain-containing protein [Sunxiuqinia elliptica]